MTDKPFAESSFQNREPIQAVLAGAFADRRRVLELSSGTGQHAVYFGEAFPHLTWQTSELPDKHAGIQAWLDEAGLANVLPPLAIDLNRVDWPAGPVDAVFNANTVHIVAWPLVENLFVGVGRVLEPGGLLCLYGPFNYGGQFTAESNARFDLWLKERDPASGVRDFEALDALARAQGLELWRDVEMPRDNRTLFWRRVRGGPA
ncbi:MAG: DUF938 domain-containing protein [Pseudomonadota bacterium]